MDLITESAKDESGQHVHGRKNVSLEDKEVAVIVVMVKNELED
jgi:hypothetical protein